MSDRVIDFLGMRRGIGMTIEAFVPGVITHWENQNQPAPQNQPFISLSLASGFTYEALVQEKKIEVIRRAVITIPDPLPPVGQAVWLYIDGWAPLPQHIIQGLDTPESVRNSILAQIQNLRPVKYGGMFEAVSQGTNLIFLNSLQLGGLIYVEGYGGIVVELIKEWAVYESMPLTFTLRMQCHGVSSTATNDFVPVGYNHPSSIWATLSFKMRRRAFAQQLYANAAVALWSYPTGGQEIPEILGAGIEPRTVGEVYCATQALNFETVPIELQQVFVDMSASKLSLNFDLNINSKHQFPLL